MEKDPRPLHDRAPTARFSGRADDYARFRPTYPPQVFNAIKECFAASEAISAADIGAGTGISARLLADYAAVVWAIEPNKTMREAAAPHPRVHWIDATAESTTLPPASLDLVLVAQAFHWFRQLEALNEFRRILKPAGRVAILWNDDDPDDVSMSAYRAALRRAADRDWPDANPFTTGGAATLGPFVFEPPREFQHGQLLTEDGLIGRAMSASYVPTTGPRHEQMLEDLRGVFARHALDGQVRLGYRCRLYLSKPVASNSPMSDKGR